MAKSKPEAQGRRVNQEEGAGAQSGRAIGKSGGKEGEARRVGTVGTVQKGAGRVRREVSAEDRSRALKVLKTWIESSKGSLKAFATAEKYKYGRFRTIIRDALANKALLIRAPEDSTLGAQLGVGFRDGPSFRVLDGYGDLFHQGAATIILNELRLLLKTKSPDGVLRIGIVSGATTGGTIAAICSEAWSVYLEPSTLPKRIEVFALNVSQTEGYKQLEGNANVLAYEFAKKILLELRLAGLDDGSRTVEAYGLSTALLQTFDEARRSDVNNKQTRQILKLTDPQRLRIAIRYCQEHKIDTGELKPEIPGEEEESGLDLVLLGVGSIHGSLFQKYCKEYGINPDELRRSGVVGDIAYTPVTKSGDRIDLKKGDTLYEFYRAVSLDVLQKMSRQGDSKKVILVARNDAAGNDPGGKKVEPIFAAIPEKRFCNVLITNRDTAQDLRNRFL